MGPAEPRLGVHWAGEVQRRRKSPRGPRPELRGGAEGAPPQPAETAVQGGTRPRKSAPVVRSWYKSPAPAPAASWLCSPLAGPLPCSLAPVHIRTHFWAGRDGGRSGSRSSAPGSESAPGASSQPRLGGPPLRINLDLGKRSACRLPETKGKREFVRGSAAFLETCFVLNDERSHRAGERLHQSFERGGGLGDTPATSAAPG